MAKQPRFRIGTAGTVVWSGCAEAAAAYRQAAAQVGHAGLVSLSAADAFVGTLGDPAAELFLFKMGFRLALPGGKVSIRKPDLGLVRRDNPVQGRDRDNR